MEHEDQDTQVPEAVQDGAAPEAAPSEPGVPSEADATGRPPLPRTGLAPGLGASAFGSRVPRSASASAAPITTDRPTPPQPITTTDWPRWTAAVFSTAPTPVATAHPISAPTSAGSAAGTGTAAWAGTTVRWPNDPTAR